MAVSLDTGIEGVSYQTQIAELKTDFPQRKENLPINASIPSRVRQVFNLYSYAQALENGVAPTLTNRHVTAPAHYSKLFEEVEAVANAHAPKDSHEKQVVQAAQVLFGAMRGDFEAFDIGRNTLIQA